jgi:hypothetical protein
MKKLFAAVLAFIVLAVLVAAQPGNSSGQSSIACGGCTNSVSGGALTCGGCTNSVSVNVPACGGCTNSVLADRTFHLL